MKLCNRTKCNYMNGVGGFPRLSFRRSRGGSSSSTASLLKPGSNLREGGCLHGCGGQGLPEERFGACKAKSCTVH